MRYVPFFILIIMPVLILARTPSSQSDDATADGFSVQMHLHDFSGDFSAGGGVTTPYFLRRKIAVRISGGGVFAADHKWRPYAAARTGIIVSHSACDELLRLYGSGGVQFLFPNHEMMNDQFLVGGYGIFGFEFYMNSDRKNNAYFLELGGTGIGAKARKLESSPVFFNGFSVGVGFRYYF